MRRFFIHSSHIQDYQADCQAILAGPEYHHLRHVLRLQIGDSIALRDEHGTEYQGTIARLSLDSAAITITTGTVLSRPSFALTLALGLLKNQKMDLVIEKVTELGVQTIVPFFSTHTVATLPQDRQANRLARWQRIAQSAAKQSGSPAPHITSPSSFAQLLSAVPDTTHTLLFYEHEQTLTLRTFARDHGALSSLWIVIGSEGGFTAEEVKQAQAASFTIASLGPSVLRAETASIAAVTLCQYLWR